MKIKKYILFEKFHVLQRQERDSEAPILTLINPNGIKLREKIV